MFRHITNTITAGGAVPTAGSNVSFVTLAVLGPQSSLVAVHSGMVSRHLQHSGAHQTSSVLWDTQWVSVALWGSSCVFV